MSIDTIKIRLTDAQIDAWKKAPSKLLPQGGRDFMRKVRRVVKEYQYEPGKISIAEVEIAEEYAYDTYRPEPRPGLIGDLMIALAQGMIPNEENKRQWDEHLLKLSEDHLQRDIENKRNQEVELLIRTFKFL